MFDQAFRAIDDVLRKEAGCTTELDYTEQTSWLLFLKYLDALEQDKADEQALDGRPYTYLLEKAFRWDSWAAPKKKDGTLDDNAGLRGDDLRDFVNDRLFPSLQRFKQTASGPNTLEYRRVLHAAPAHPRHDPGRAPAARRNDLRRRVRLRWLSLRVL
jgi:type I restriction enzyme M protein